MDKSKFKNYEKVTIKNRKPPENITKNLEEKKERKRKVLLKAVTCVRPYSIFTIIKKYSHFFIVNKYCLKKTID